MKTIKTLLHAVAIAAVLSASLDAHLNESQSLNAPVSYAQMHPELFDDLRRADKEREWVHSLLKNHDVEARSFSIDQIKATLEKLVNHQEALMQAQDSGRHFGEKERRYLLLVQELIRQLTNARIAYEDHIKTSESVKRAAVPLGVGAAVAGGLLVVDMIADIGLDVSTALLSGAAAGAAAGVITYRGEVSQAATDLKDMVADVFSDRQSLRDVGTVAASVAGAAALSGLVWHQRDTVLGIFGLHTSAPRSLAQAAKENGLHN